MNKPDEMGWNNLKLLGAFQNKYRSKENNFFIRGLTYELKVKKSFQWNSEPYRHITDQ